MTLIVAGSAGLGHWMRCIALSEFLPNPVLYSPVNHACLRSAPLEVRIGWDKLPESDLAIVDTYRHRETIVNELKAKQICVIADEPYHSFQVDWIVSPHIGTERLAYHIPGTVLAGAQYALVRPGFRRFRRARTGPVRRLIVCLGSDAPELERDIKSAILGKSIEVYVYGGTQDTLPLYPHIRTGYYSHFPEAMYGADLAIAPASMTMLELLCCGVPTITYASNAHQRWIQAHSPTVPFSVSNLIGLINDEPRRRELSQRGLDTVDGLGCERVSSRICATSHS